MLRLTAFGAVSVTVTLVGSVFERRSHWFSFVFAAGCAMTSAYAFLVEVWPIGVIGFAWYFVAMRRWVRRAEADGRAS